MEIAKNTSPLVIGLALFSMFFGSGNLIFPLFVGQIAQSQWIAGGLGFLLTAALVPFSGVIAMLLYKGDYTGFFNRLGGKIGFIITAILLTIWIPLGSGPRCITLAYASMLQFFSLPSLWVFSILYSVILYFVASKKNRLIDLLGYVLTPLLLICLIIVIAKGIAASGSMEESQFTSLGIFFRGLQEGYNTMDLIASFFFSATIIGILRASTNNDKQALKVTFKSCLIAVSLLIFVYSGLVLLAANNSSMLLNIPKDQLLAFTSKTLLSPTLGFVAVMAIALACFTTSIALAVVYTDFLKKTIFKKIKSPLPAIMTTLVLTFGMSIFRLEGITLITAPLLAIFYPLLIVMIIFNVTMKVLEKRKASKANRSLQINRTALQESE